MLPFQIHEKMYERVTPNDLTVDECTQPSVNFPALSVGLVAQDEESYSVRVARTVSTII